MSLNNFAQVRSQLVQLCNQDRFAAAHMFLVGSGYAPERFPGLWEYLARRSDLQKDGVIAHEARRSLWQAGLRYESLALSEAAYYLGGGDWKSASFVLTQVFGTATDNRAAHFKLAECFLAEARSATQHARTRTNRDRAIRIDSKHAPQTAQEAAALVDLLRFSGALERAWERNAAARAAYPTDARFDLRAASILDQMRDPAAAIAAWRHVAAQHSHHRSEALLKIHDLCRQLDRETEMARAAAELVLGDLPLDMRMRLAIVMRQRDMIMTIARLAAQSTGARKGLDHASAVAMTDMLMQNGDIGLTVWLRRQGVAVSETSKSVLTAVGFNDAGHLPLPDTLREAAAMRSPDIMLPLSDHLKRQPRPAGWPGRRSDFGTLLLVNGTLGGGGAERQFVALVAALLASGVPNDRIHCAFFSLEADRGFDRFLPDLSRLGVTIHDLRRRHVANTALPPDQAAVIDALPLEFEEDVRGLWHLVCDLAPDTLHGWQDRAGLAAALVGDLAQTERIVVSARNLAPDTRGELRLAEMQALYLDLLARDNCTLTANARVAGEDYARWLGTDAHRIALLRNAIDPGVFSPGRVRASARWRPGRPFVLGGVFRLAAPKRPHLWLETVAQLRAAGALPFLPVIYGAGPMRDELLARAKTLGLADLEINSDTVDPVEIYGRLDVILLMSRVEGLPNALLEAQACGIATAACAVGGAAEATMPRGSGAGLLLEPELSAEEAARAIADWLPEALVGSAGRRQAFVQRNHAPEAIAADARALYLTGRIA